MLPGRLKSSRQLTTAREQVKVAEQHAGNEEPTVPPVDDVEEVVDEQSLASQASVPGTARERHGGRIDYERSSELHRQRPSVVIVCVPRLALEDETVVLEIAVPLPDLSKVCRLWHLSDRVAGSDLEKMPTSHPCECRSCDRDIESQPSSEQGRGQVLRHLRNVACLHESEGFCRQDVARDDEKDSHREMATREQNADAGEADGIVFAIPPESVFENVFSADARMAPNLMMETEDKKCCEASEAVKVRSAV